METSLSMHYTPIRQVQTRRDVAAIADLVELCFADYMDPDGREYLRYLRRISMQSFGLVADSPVLSMPAKLPIQGFVWEEDGHIIGNLTLIPFYRADQRYYLIANVAVHPDHRRKGIARRLTSTAIDYIRSQGNAQIWLHVRADNPAAQALYRQLGFTDQFERTTWMWDPAQNAKPEVLDKDISVTVRRRADWELQAKWLDRVYPPEMTWNLPMDKNRLKPGFWRELRQLFAGTEVIQLSARFGGRLVGVASCESMRMYADSVWVVTDPEFQDAAISALLPMIQRLSGRKRNLSVNYPAGLGDSAFKSATFYPHLTLIWMKYTLLN
jgi:ribosomal protein S18 acetylase RimI-like enzyme